MKMLVVYSSLTGNTRMVAESINSVVKGDIFNIEDAPAPDSYDVIFTGFWVDKGTADAKMLEYFKTLVDKNKIVVPFYTLGAYPDSQHAQDVFTRTCTALGENKIPGHYRCQGKIDPKLVDWMKTLPPEHGHGMNPERVARIEEAAKHPDAADLKNAADFAREMLEKIGHGTCCCCPEQAKKAEDN